MCVSDRGGQVCVGDVAAHRRVLVVFAGVQWNLLKATLCDGSLSPGTLNSVHMDRSSACKHTQTQQRLSNTSAVF